MRKLLLLLALCCPASLMAEVSIVGGTYYVDTVNGVNNLTSNGGNGCGESTGAGACASLVYLWNTRSWGTLTSNVVINCVGATAESISGVTFTARSSATYSVTIKGNNTSGTWSTSKYRITGNTDSTELTFSDINIVFDSVQFTITTTGNNVNLLRLSASGAVSWIIKNCVFSDSSASGTGHIAISFNSASSGTLLVSNSVIFGFSRTDAIGIYCYGGFPVLVYGCTFHDNAKAVSDPGGNRNISLKNNIFHSCTTDIDGWQTASCTNNSTSKATCDWTGGAFGATDHGSVSDGNFAFTDLTNHDFSLTSSTSTSKVSEAGATLGAPYNTDIKGVTRTAPYSVGAFEYVPAASSSRGLLFGVYP